MFKTSNPFSRLILPSSATSDNFAKVSTMEIPVSKAESKISATSPKVNIVVYKVFFVKDTFITNWWRVETNPLLL